MKYIVNTQPRLIHLPPPVFTDSAGGITLGESISVPPTVPNERGETIGVEVDSVEWDRLKSNATVKSWIALGWLKEGAAPTTEGPARSLPAQPLATKDTGASTARRATESAAK